MSEAIFVWASFGKAISLPIQLNSKWLDFLPEQISDLQKCMLF